jgi:hypothetical protein
MDDSTWTEEAKREWLAAQCGAPTHVVTFEPMYQIELCIPPWEPTDRQIARSAVTWGERMSHVFHDAADGGSVVVAAHHEGNSLEVHTAVTPRPRLHRIP